MLVKLEQSLGGRAVENSDNPFILPILSPVNDATNPG
jgi:hypothetical protein